MSHILCINPWICDFAAYDFWAKPVGLLSLAAILRAHDIDVSYIDCLDRFHPNAAPADPHARCGRGPYLKTRIPRPGGLSDVNRRYSRYGILPEWFESDLRATPKPDLVFVTSLMTYWYPGVVQTIQAIRAVHPGVPVVLGGIYATLCPAHAEAESGADRVVSGPAISDIFDMIATYTGRRIAPRFDPDDLDTYPYPAWDLQRQTGYVPLMTSVGCPFSCDYCASNILQPKRMTRSPASVVKEIRHWHDTLGVEDFVFYDDALLVDAANHAVPILEGIIAEKGNLRFHTPNAVHIRNITPEVARLLNAAGMMTLRLGLETTDFENRRMDRKVKAAEFRQAAAHLHEAGFDQKRVGAYLLFGLPGQTIESIESAIDAVKKAGITPILAHYTPIPHTSLWDEAVAASRYDLAADPVYTNNAVMPCRPSFDWGVISQLKQRIYA